MKRYHSFIFHPWLLLLLLLVLTIGDAWGVSTVKVAEIASAGSWTNESLHTTLVSNSYFTISCTGGGNNGKYFTSDNSWRIYSGGTAKVTPASGYEIIAVTSEPALDWAISSGTASYASSTTKQITSITVTYKTTSADACHAVSLTGGWSTIILPAGSPTYTAKDWRYAGSPIAYGDEATRAIGANNYCATFTQAYDGNTTGGLQFKASSGVLQISGITSTYGVCVDVSASGTNNFTLELTGAANVTGNNTTLSIATESTNATLTISKSTSSAGYISTISIRPKTPKVSFADIIHGLEFADVEATISGSTLEPNKTTPTHADWTGAHSNTCEETHVHLAGWIEKSWTEAHPNATHDDIVSAGANNYFAAGAEINVQTNHGKTYYAVWAAEDPLVP